MRYLGVTKTYTDSYKKRDFEMRTGAKLIPAGNVSGHFSDREQPIAFRQNFATEFSRALRAEQKSARDGHLRLNNSGVRRKRKEQVV